VRVYAFLVFDAEDQVRIEYFPQQNKCLMFKNCKGSWEMA